LFQDFSDLEKLREKQQPRETRAETEDLDVLSHPETDLRVLRGSLSRPRWSGKDLKALVVLDLAALASKFGSVGSSRVGSRLKKHRTEKRRGAHRGEATARVRTCLSLSAQLETRGQGGREKTRRRHRMVRVERKTQNLLEEPGRFELDVFFVSECLLVGQSEAREGRKRFQRKGLRTWK
jgi:hypothetical protein